MPVPEWLPPIEPFAGDWATEWKAYENKIYAIFVADFVTSQAMWRGKRVSVRYEPAFDGKGDTFWHLTTEKVGNDRDPDTRRCERIRWARAVVQAAPDNVRTWAQTRRGEERIAIALPDFSYLVVLIPRGDRAHLLTMYCIERESRREQFRKEWEANKR